MTKRMTIGRSIVNSRFALPDREDEQQQKAGDDVMIEQNVGVLSPVVQEDGRVQRVNVEAQLHRLNDVVVQRYRLVHGPFWRAEELLRLVCSSKLKIRKFKL